MSAPTPSTRLSDLDRANTPIVQVDAFLLALRWGIIGALGIMANLPGFGGEMMALPVAVWLGIVAYNIPVSIYTFRSRPLMYRNVRGLLFGDLAQAFVAVLLTGGWRSFYFLLFLLLMAELVLVWRWKWAFLAMLGIGGLQVIVMIWGASRQASPLAAYLITGKLFLSLMVGSLSILFGELVRNEEAARQAAARRSRHIATLKDVLIQINENGLDKEAIMAALLRGVDELSSAAYSLLLTPVKETGWRVVASTTQAHPPDQCYTDFTPPTTTEAFFINGGETLNDLPAFAGNDGLRQGAGFFLRATTGDVTGLLFVGWKQPHPLEEEDKTFLLTLAQEASMALRNARLFEKEQEHVARLHQFDQRQSVFFSAIGHELKTPISVLKMLMPSLHQCQELPEAVRVETLDTIEQNLNRLQALTTDWLESARLDAGAVSLYRQDVDVIKLARALIANLTPAVKRKKLEIILDAEADLPSVWGDRRRLEQVLSNLLNNAIKFSPPGEQIHMVIHHIGPNIQICVTDRGPGVPPEERDQIFNKFYIATRNKALAGSGLGLFISRALVHLHGGRIWLEDRPGGGSRFCFTIPISSQEIHDAESQ